MNWQLFALILFQLRILTNGPRKGLSYWLCEITVFAGA